MYGHQQKLSLTKKSTVLQQLCCGYLSDNHADSFFGTKSNLSRHPLQPRLRLATLKTFLIKQLSCAEANEVSTRDNYVIIYWSQKTKMENFSVSASLTAIKRQYDNFYVFIKIILIA